MRLELIALVMAAAMAPGQQDTPTIFPSDSSVPTSAEATSLLAAVCPGAVSVGKTVGCRTGCPEYTSFGIDGSDFEWSMAAVTRGHFLSRNSEDAVLAMAGCEPHQDNFGGTVLLTRRFGQWQMVWYKVGIESSQCHKVSLQDGREILVCLSGDGAQGVNVSNIYAEDLLAPSPGPIFSAFDSTLTCGLNDVDVNKPFPVIRARIDKVEFSGRDRRTSALTVTASLGRRQMTRADVEACLKGNPVLPVPVSYRIQYRFNGHAFRVLPSTAKAALLFDAR